MATKRAYDVVFGSDKLQDENPDVGKEEITVSQPSADRMSDQARESVAEVNAAQSRGENAHMQRSIAQPSLDRSSDGMENRMNEMSDADKLEMQKVGAALSREELSNAQEQSKAELGNLPSQGTPNGNEWRGSIAVDKYAGHPTPEKETEKEQERC